MPFVRTNPATRRVLLSTEHVLDAGSNSALPVVILVAAIALLGSRHDRGINHLAATRNVALGLQILAEALKQLLNQTGLRKRLSEQPQRRAVRNAVLDAESQKPRERQPVAHLILDLFVGQIVKRLQHQHPKHHHDVDRLAAGGALFLAHQRQHRRLDLGSEALKRHHASNHFQRIALRSNRRKPPVRIEESKLPHRPHTRESCCHDSDSHKFAEVAIFRGALKFDVGRADYLGPLFVEVTDELPKPGGRTWKSCVPKLTKSPPYSGISKTGVDLLVELFNDINGSIRRGANASPP